MAKDKFKKEQEKSSKPTTNLASASSFIDDDEMTDLDFSTPDFAVPTISPRGEKIHISPTGLTFEDDISVGEIKEFAKKLDAIETSLQWMWGDLANQCQVMKLTETDLVDIAEMSKYTVETLYNFAGIARMFKPELRDVLPSFTHYKRLYESEIDGRSLRPTMKLITDGNWSTRDLEYYLATGQHPKEDKGESTLSVKMIQKTDREIFKLKKQFVKADDSAKSEYAEIARLQMERWAEVYSEFKDA